MKDTVIMMMMMVMILALVFSPCPLPGAFDDTTLENTNSTAEFVVLNELTINGGLSIIRGPGSFIVEQGSTVNLNLRGTIRMEDEVSLTFFGQVRRVDACLLVWKRRGKQMIRSDQQLM